MLHEDETVAPAKTLLSRRKVIGTALWAAPAITLATAAPALAASGDTLSFSAKNVTSAGNGTNSGLDVSFTAKATSTHGTVTTIAVTLAFPSTSGTITVPTNPGGWTASNPVGGAAYAAGTVLAAGSSIVYTKTTTTTGTASPGTTASFPATTFKTSVNKGGSGTLTFTATGNGYTTGSTSFAYSF